MEKVRMTLKGMGFRAAQARYAVSEVERLHDETPSVEQALREALQIATAESG
jgi:Holliday junction resolvasome RuvABC DNA-binding subunit